ncbi:MAG: hypothetical protein ABJL44_14380 [Algibacter sp.]
MITVADYAKRTTKQGEDFYVLILQGGVEAVKSKKSGKMYFKTQKTSVPTTFNEATCQSVLGCQFSGTIERVACEPYDFKIDEENTITLDFTWVYVDNTEEIVGEQVIEEVEVI